MKSLVVAAAFATVLALPALAEETARPERPRHEMRESMREDFKADTKEFREERKAEFEAARKTCHERMKAATTPAAKEAVIKDCRSRQDGLRKEAFDEKTKLIEKHRSQMDAKRAEMRSKHEEMKKEFKAEPARR